MNFIVTKAGFYINLHGTVKAMMLNEKAHHSNFLIVAFRFL